MRKAANIGGKIGQFGTFGALTVYCFKGKSIKLKLLSGFLFMYWIDHFYTLGSYTGILLTMPSNSFFISTGIYQKVGDHFTQYEPINDKNLFLRLNEQINIKPDYDYEDTQEILNKIFKQ